MDTYRTGAEMAVLQSTVVQGGRPEVQLQQITTRRILGGFQSRFSEQRRKQKTGKYHCFETPTASPETQLSASPTTHGPPMQLPTVPENSVATSTSIRTHILDLGQPTAQVQNGMGGMVARQTASTDDQTPDDSHGITELNMGNTADTIDGSKVYSKPWAALSNIYSGYIDLITGSRYTREDTEDSEDLSGNADDTFRSSMGEVPTNEEYLQAYNKLWKALLDGNLDTIKRLDREGAYLYQQGCARRKHISEGMSLHVQTARWTTSARVRLLQHTRAHNRFPSDER
ncbi:hypothetical protein BJ742DRAFT_304759 [Cladochytrium replicatum]|nr:hypothetical protein BJ742DRAFT_304759 [Cladochytrium replicatum]